MFSSRLPVGLPSNAIAATIAELRSAGTAFLDLTESNPTRVGLVHPPTAILAISDPRGLVYEPESLGLASARAAVAGEHGRSGAPIDPSRIVLTASTSEAYALLFKLLCDAGDDVLVPQPGYPLFESLAGLECVRVRPYRLEYHGRWSIDRASVGAALTPRTRAVLVVTPNNPTGSMVRAADRDWLAALAAERGLAIISDEVFHDYLLAPAPDAVSCAGETRALTFVLGGLSKSAALPQMKLGWMAVSGPDTDVARAMDQLDVICDTYLSVSTPVQLAAPALIEAGAVLRHAILGRLLRNLAALREALRALPSVTLLEPEGGWSAVLRVPATISEESLVLRLLNEHHVLVHPGYFFDFASEAFLVISLIPEPDVFDDGVRRVLRAIESGAMS